jgi:hypothetical protein
VGFVPQALTGEAITRVSVTLTATDATTNTVWLNLKDGAWSGTLYRIPVGTNRTFTAEAFDSVGQLRFRGQATGVTITEGTTVLVTITLQSVNSGPVYDNTVPCIDSLIVSASRVLVGGTLSLRATAHDPDVGDTLSMAWTASAGSFSAANMATTTWTAPSTAGTVTLTLKVTDSRGASATIHVPITVLATDGTPGLGNANVSVSFNMAPTVSTLTVSQSPVAVGETTTATATAVDADGDAMSYAWSASCAGTWTDATSSTAYFTPSAVPPGDTCGNCTLTFTVTDARGGRNTGNLHICVGGPNIVDPPYIIQAYQSAETVTGRGLVTLRVLAGDGEGSALSFSWAASAGTLGMASNGFTSSEILWTAPACAPASAAPIITATVTNSRGFSVSTRFTVFVIDAPDCSGNGGDGGTGGGGDGGTDGGTGGGDGGTEGPSGTWEYTGSMISPRYQHTTHLLPSGKVLAFGGRNDSTGWLDSAETYDPASGLWSPAGHMNKIHEAGYSVTSLPGGKVLVIGGAAASGSAEVGRSVDIYDPATNKWTAAAPMTYARHGHTATLRPDGKVLVIGGNDDPLASKIPELYDPATNTWQPLMETSASGHRYHSTLPLPDGRLLVLGGNTIAETYTPATRTWATIPDMSGSWSLATLQASGKIFLLEGHHQSVGASAYMYDPVTGLMSPAGSLRYPRTYAAITRLGSGKLLITGGWESISPITEVFDPVTGTSSFSQSMPSSRYFHTATQLRSGKVLVTGGYGAGGALQRALLYTP